MRVVERESWSWGYSRLTMGDWSPRGRGLLPRLGGGDPNLPLPVSSMVMPCLLRSRRGLLIELVFFSDIWVAVAAATKGVQSGFCWIWPSGSFILPRSVRLASRCELSWLVLPSSLPSFLLATAAGELVVGSVLRLVEASANGGKGHWIVSCEAGVFFPGLGGIGPVGRPWRCQAQFGLGCASFTPGVVALCVGRLL